MKQIQQIKVGQHWRAISTEDGFTEWLFYIVLETSIKGRKFFLGVKLNFNNKKPIIDFDSLRGYVDNAQAWWFDSAGKGPKLFNLKEIFEPRR